MSVTDLQFWHQYLGQYLSSAPMEQSTKIQIETRLKRGIGLNTLGAGIDAHYVVTPEHAFLIGKIERENTDHVTFIPSDGENSISGDRFIARWLTDSKEPKTPFLVGVIGKSNPNASFTVSQSTPRCAYCASGGGFSFDLDRVRAAKALIGELPWKTVAPGIHQMSKYMIARSRTDTYATQRELDKLNKMLAKTPVLEQVLAKLNVKPNSGEYKILSWAAIS